MSNAAVFAPRLLVDLATATQDVGEPHETSDSTVWIGPSGFEAVLIRHPPP